MADVLPEGKITTRRHLRTPCPACRAPVEGVLLEEKSAPRKRSRQRDASTGRWSWLEKCHEEGPCLPAVSGGRCYALKAMEENGIRGGNPIPPPLQTPAADETKT